MAMKNAIVREPGPAQVEVSPIPHGLPTEPDHPLDKRELTGYLFWGSLGLFILTTEALAAFWSGFPIPTISSATGRSRSTTTGSM